jgi:hypothetical protein
MVGLASVQSLSVVFGRRSPTSKGVHRAGRPGAASGVGCGSAGGRHWPRPRQRRRALERRSHTSGCFCRGRVGPGGGPWPTGRAAAVYVGGLPSAWSTGCQRERHLGLASRHGAPSPTGSRAPARLPYRTAQRRSAACIAPAPRARPDRRIPTPRTALSTVPLLVQIRHFADLRRRPRGVGCASH